MTLGRAASLFFGSVSLTWTGTIPAPNIQSTVQQSVKEVEEDWRQAGNYSFIERDIESKRESKPITKTYQVLMIDGSPYNRLIGIDDRALTPQEQAEEQRKLQEAIQKRQHENYRERDKRVAKYERERHQDQAMLLAMVDAFTFRLIGDETVDGRDCWVFDAQPKPGYEPVTRETKVLKGMRGRMWIDKATNQWVKVTAEVVKPVSFYGFFAKVGEGTRFTLEQEPVSQNVWLPKHFCVNVNATALGFLNEDYVDDESYRDYKPMSQMSAELQTR